MSTTSSSASSPTRPKLKASVFRKAARFLKDDLFACNALFFAAHPSMAKISYEDWTSMQREQWSLREQCDPYCMAFAAFLKPAGVYYDAWYGDVYEAMDARIIGLLLCAEILEEEGSLPVQPHMVSSS